MILVGIEFLVIPAAAGVVIAEAAAVTRMLIGF